MNNFALNVPINTVSFGFTSIAILREIYNRGLSPCIFPIGNPDLSAQKPDNDFNLWLQSCLNKSLKMHKRDTPVIKLWHIQDLMQSVSKEQVAISFLETDSLTETETNILNQQKSTLVTSNFTRETMQDYGVRNVDYLELGFDSYNFYDTKRNYLNDRITMGLFGKFEARKHHAKILNLWAKKYGNNRDYMLHAAIYNPFFRPEDNQTLINNALEGKSYWNIQFFPYLKTNIEYNDLVNSCNIVISLSGGEGRDLPCFHSCGLGKWVLGLRAHSYLDYLNDENSVLINPSGKVKAVDGIFFHENSMFSTGNFYSWSDEDFYDGMERITQKYKKNHINIKGLELQKRTYKETVNKILEKLD